MASGRQGAKQPVLPDFEAEHDHANRSFKTSSLSILGKPSFHELTTVPVCTPSRLSKGSTANDMCTDPPAIPRWMSSKQVQSFRVNAFAKSGLPTNGVPPTSMSELIRHNAQLHETVGPLSRLPSSKLVLGSKGQDNTCDGVQLRPGTPNSRHLFQQQLPARSALNVGSSPIQVLKRGEQREDPEISKKDLLSLLLHKQGPADLFPGPPAGKPSRYSVERSSWVSKFPFQIVPTVEEAEERHSIQLRETLGHRMLSESTSDVSSQGASKGLANVPSQLVDSKVQVDHSKVLVPHSPSLIEVASFVIPTNFPLKSPCALSATLTNSNVPSLKRDWTATLTQCDKHPQLLPEFFAQQKVISSVKVDPCKIDGNPEMTSTVFFSQKSLASRVNEETVGFNLPSRNGATYSDRTRNSSSHYENVKQHDFGCGREAQTQTSVLEQHLGKSLQHVDLPKAKLETICERLGTECGKLASRECTEKHDKLLSSERSFLMEVPLRKGYLAADQAARQPSTASLDIDGVMGNSQSAELMLFKESASTQELGAPSSVSACVAYLPALKQSQNLKELERDPTIPANKYAQIVADWGEFLAAPSIGQTAETHLLPFQQRFVQLQEFLQQCDGSNNKEYCLRALQSLSATARSGHAAELESRAVRLSLEEGREMKRAKLLHVLEELPEGTYLLNPCARPTGSLFSAPRAVAVVKEEA